ncbi:VWA domain-containing protein [Caballeronia sp. SBC2]|uniref:VWA domain-containing protein n=1 Tax=Caballeronia sp. SBC2 TaxID=2705547 RepID=UPI0013E1518D|nr:VWA domain-containing protein [Caballeronia sp. SBC2]QIE30197.1 hypothetical protein SBC2_82730 [Caballeronia sp. SBC2]
MTLRLVCDVSGSMRDDGKPFAMRTVVMAVAQWVRFGYGEVEIRLCGWGSEVRDFFEWSAKDEFPAELLTFDGTSDWKVLIQSLEEQPDGKVLLFTDGFWPHRSEKLLKQWRECRPLGALRIIKIGADANPRLSGPEVFTADDFFAALDGWLEGSPA